MAPRSQTRRPVFQPIRIGPKTSAQPLLPGAALHRRRPPDRPGFQGGESFAQGRGRLGRYQHRILLQFIRSPMTRTACRRAFWDAGDVRNLRAMTDHIHKYGRPWPVLSCGMEARMLPHMESPRDASRPRASYAFGV